MLREIIKMAEQKISTKHKQVDKTQTMIFGIVIAASIVTVTALVAAKSFLSQAIYLGKVVNGKEKALKQLTSNEDAVNSLVTAYKAFASQDPNLIGGSSLGTGGRNGDNGRLVLDALPSKYDFPALATSLEKMLSGYNIGSITGSDDSVAQEQNAGVVAPVDMPFSINISTNYTGLQQLLGSFEKSIRPFQITKLSVSGTNSELKIDMAAKTFYQPEKSLKIENKEVK